MLCMCFCFVMTPASKEGLFALLGSDWLIPFHEDFGLHFCASASARVIRLDILISWRSWVIHRVERMACALDRAGDFIEYILITCCDAFLTW